MNKNLLVFVLTLLLTANSYTANAQWTSLSTGTVENIFNISFPGVATGYLVTANGHIRKTTDGGQSWTFLTTPQLVWDIGFVTDDIGFATCDSGILKTDNGGVTWSKFINNDCLYENIFIYDSLVIVTGEKYTWDSIFVARSIDYGVTWQETAIYYDMFPIWGLTFLSADTAYATGLSGTILQTNDGGITWSNLYQDPVGGWEDLYYFSPDTGFLMTTIILRTTDGNVTFNQVNTNGNNTAFYDMEFINDSVGYVVGGNGISSGAILKTTDRGTNWDLDTSSVQTFDVLSFSPTSLYAGGTGGVLFKLDVFTGITSEPADEGPSMSIHPNPAKENFTVTINRLSSFAILRLMDLSGRVIYEKSIAPGIITKTELTTDIAPGIYVVDVTSEKFNSIVKIVKQGTP